MASIGAHMNTNSNKHRSPSPKLNLRSLRQQQQQAQRPVPSAPGGPPVQSPHATPTPSALPLPTPNSCSARSPSFRGAGMAIARRMSRLPRGSLLRREDCGRQSFRLLATSNPTRPLVPLPEDLTHDEYHQVEDHYTRFGPIDSQLTLTAFLTSLGENLSEASLYNILRKIRQEKRKEEAISARQHTTSAIAAELASARARSSSIAGELVSARARSSSILVPCGGGGAADYGGGLSGSSDDDALSVSHAGPWRRSSAAVPSSVPSGGSTTTVASPTQHKKLDAILKKHFLRPFFCLEDVALLLRHVKRGVLTNRSTRDEAKEVFDALCADGVDAIDAAEFLKVTRNFALQLNVDEVLREVDEDGSGQIELNEFRQLLGRVGAASTSVTVGADDDDNGLDAFDDDVMGTALGQQPPAASLTGCGGAGAGQSHALAATTGSVDDMAASCARDVGGTDESGYFSVPDAPVAIGPPNLNVNDLQTPLSLPQRVGGFAPTLSLSSTRFAALLHAQQQQQQAAMTSTVDVLEAQLRSIRRDLSSEVADPLAGIEPQRALASYLALEKHNSLRHRPTRLPVVASVRRKPAKQRGAAPHNKHHTPPPAQRSGNVRLPPIEKPQMDLPAPQVDTTRAAVIRPAGAPSHLPAASGAHRLPPVQRPAEHRQPFHVVEGVFPSWRESYHLYIHPL